MDQQKTMLHLVCHILHYIEGALDTETTFYRNKILESIFDVNIPLK